MAIEKLNPDLLFLVEALEEHIAKMQKVVLELRHEPPRLTKAYAALQDLNKRSIDTALGAAQEIIEKYL